MNNEKNLTEAESLDVIRRMIATAQNEIKDDSFYYLVWGWLVFSASVLHYALMSASYANDFLPWVVLMPLGGILTGWYTWRYERNQKAHTYVEEVMKYVLIAFLVSLFTVLFFMSKLGLATYPIVMLVYGMWLFVSGGAIRFRPLILGGVINWVIGIGAFFATFPVQLLLLATAVLLGYIIPGHMLKNRFRKQQSVTPVM